MRGEDGAQEEERNGEREDVFGEALSRARREETEPGGEKAEADQAENGATTAAMSSMITKGRGWIAVGRSRWLTTVNQVSTLGEKILWRDRC